MNSNLAIELQNVKFDYVQGSQSFSALKEISLEIKRGEFIAITGQSGSGKTTLMNILGLLASPTAGEISFQNEPMKALDPNRIAEFRNRNIGFVFQQFHLLSRLTVLENVLLPLSYLSPTPSAHEVDEYRQKALSLLDRLGISNQAGKKPETLSGGQKQRVAIARALLLEPEVILADEPTGALDSQTSKEVLGILQQLNEQGRTVIVITHDLEVARYAKRRISLKDGAVISDELQDGVPTSNKSNFFNSQIDCGVVQQNALWRSKLYRWLSPLHDAWQALSTARLRSALTSLGLVIGVSAISIMLTLGWGAQDVILKIFTSEGADRIWVGPEWRSSNNWYWRGLNIDSELPVLRNVFRNYGEIHPSISSWNEKMSSGGVVVESSVRPIFDVADFLQNTKGIDRGRMLTPHEFAEGARVAVVGANFSDLFPKNYRGRLTNPLFPIGERISFINKLSTTVTVVGVLKAKDRLFGESANSEVFLPMKTYSKYTLEKYTHWISIVPHKGVEHRWLANSIANFLHLKTGTKVSFHTYVPEEFISRIMTFIAIFQGLTALIGGLCIIVSGIGIMNIMLVTIVERVREIGLRKAIGAKAASITKQFLLECVLLCSVSGVVGVVLSLLFCNIVILVAHNLMPATVPLQPLFFPAAIIVALLTSVGCGILFGMMPALKAAKLEPSEALRAD